MSYVGQGRPGLRNRQLAAGRGRYVADVRLPRMTEAAVLRSPHASARIRSIDVSKAEQLPGVVCVVTGREIAERTNPIPGSWDPAEMGARAVDWYALCPERVRYVGEAVAVVVADDRFVAHEALRAIEVDYEPLPAVTDPDAALAPDSPLVEPDWDDNVLVGRDYETGDPDAAFAAADHVVSGRIQCNRVTGASIEPRGCVASYEPFEGRLTFWDSTQDPHPLRTVLAQTLRLEENAVRVIQPDVGGAFGLKQPTFQEEPLIAYLSLKLGRPVRWIEQRRENFETGGHSRDTRFDYQAAFDGNGTIVGISIDVVADVGAPTALCGYGMSFVTWYCLPTFYRVQNVRLRLRSVVTNKCPWNSYRGYGKDAATFLMERIVDHVARTLELDRADVRFKNFIQPDEFPYSQPSGAMMDSGDYPGALRQLLADAGLDELRRWQQDERGKGRSIGIGLSMELTPEGASVPGSLVIGGFDGATVRIGPSADVTVLTGVTSPGSGNETAMAQIAADELGVDIASVNVIQGDTDACPWGLGNYSSRSVIMGGSAVQAASAKLRERILTVASRMLEAAPQDLELRDGKVEVRGTPARPIALQQVVKQFYQHPHGEYMEDVEPSLETTSHFRIGNVWHQPETQGRLSTYPTWPYAAVACAVEVDRDTGEVEVLRWVYVHDAGTIVNPLLVDANLHGAITQGIGGVLYEEIRYADDGRPQTLSFADYTIPTALDVPTYELSHRSTPSPYTPLGTKGVGESGVGGCLNALASAIEDALPDIELRLERLPLTPAAVWHAIAEAERREVPA